MMNGGTTGKQRKPASYDDTNRAKQSALRVNVTLAVRALVKDKVPCSADGMEGPLQHNNVHD